MNEKKFPIDLLGKWLQVLMKSLDESLAEKTKKEIMEKCGKCCVIYHGDIDEIKRIKRKGENLEGILEWINRENRWCGEWIKKGNIISSICHKCECPFVRAEIMEPSPILCYCSLGWVKSVFELIMEKPVEVQLKKAIGRGDKVCQFIIHDIE